MALTTNKEALVKQVADRANLTQTDANKALTAALEIIMETVADGGKVTLTGFATFERVDKAARPGRNPKTGETIQIPARKAPKIVAGKTFKELCN